MDVAALKSIISSAAAKGIANRTGIQSDIDTTATQFSKDVYESKLAEIASKYDVKNITPRQAVAMSNELYEIGSISLLEKGCFGSARIGLSVRL
ncbi:MAG TPA: hypothetical protein HPP94_11965 [Desulfuromonadales bacterium]|nr:hypothetical protein [Desulfuromonadales bacterium]